jgi:hypothetical protein
MKNILIALILLSSTCFCDVLSTDGKIRFDIQMDGQPEMTLNSTGLSIGALLPSSNLHVNGNAIISNQLFVGGSSGSSNLNVTGTMGFGFQTVTSSTTLSGNSIVLVDSSAGNITLSLPEASSYSGRKYTIKKTSPLNRISIRDGGFIDSYSDVSLSVNNMGSLSVISSSGNWYILNISGNGTSVSTDNLVGWWKLDEVDGVTVANSIGSGSSGTLSNGPILTNGKINNAISFDGVDDFLSLPDPITGNPTTNNFTICFWLYWDSSDSFVAMRDSSATAGAGTLFPYDNSGTIIFRVGGTTASSSASSADYEDRWVFFSLTNDKTTSILYADGESVGSLSPGANSFLSPWVIARNGGVSTYEKCFFDDFRIYNKALTPTEIQALYNQGQ